MDIDKIIDLVKSVPEDQLNDDQTLKSIIDIAAKQSGKTYTDNQLDQLLQLFKAFAQEQSPSSIISKILTHGGSEDLLNEIKDKLDS